MKVFLIVRLLCVIIVISIHLADAFILSNLHCWEIKNS